MTWVTPEVGLPPVWERVLAFWVPREPKIAQWDGEHWHYDRWELATPPLAWARIPLPDGTYP